MRRFQVSFVFVSLAGLAALAPACADEIPPARSADSPIGTSAEEAPMPAVPSFSGRAASYDPDKAGPATAGHAHHHGGDAPMDGMPMGGMPMNHAMPATSATAAPAMSGMPMNHAMPAGTGPATVAPAPAAGGPK